MVPELLSKDDLVFPHEMEKYVSYVPHFRRIWQHYRYFTLNTKFNYLVSEGKISKEEAD